VLRAFGRDSALLLIDCQYGIDSLQHWGGSSGRRNNPGAERNIAELLNAWRSHGNLVFYSVHDSREASSPLKLSLPTGEIKGPLLPLPGELVIRKDVNSAFVGTNLDIALRRASVRRLIIVGFFTNMCVSSTARMANNLGFDTYVVDDACACSNRVGFDGIDYDPEVVHAVTIASLHGEFCTALASRDALALLDTDVSELERVQGNE